VISLPQQAVPFWTFPQANVVLCSQITELFGSHALDSSLTGNNSSHWQAYDKRLRLFIFTNPGIFGGFKTNRKAASGRSSAAPWI
jgi:hypothetical protein